MSEAGELSGELGVAGWGGIAAGAEIAAAEEIGAGDDGGPHGPVFVGTLGPGEVAIEPEVEAHGPILHRSQELPDGIQELAVLEGLAQR
jgi:hypothetical protein